MKTNEVMFFDKHRSTQNVTSSNVQKVIRAKETPTEINLEQTDLKPRAERDVTTSAHAQLPILSCRNFQNFVTWEEHNSASAR